MTAANAETCLVCGAEFAAKAGEKFCSEHCRKKAEVRRAARRHREELGMKHAFAQAWKCGHPTSVTEIMRARTKPKGVSAIRWRIELRRRARPEWYEACH